MSSGRAIALSAALVAAVALAGCGGGGGAPRDAGSDADGLEDARADVDLDDADLDAEVDDDGGDGDGETSEDADVDEDGEADADADADADEPSAPWSFVVITDLHVGEGYDDYGTVGYDDSGGDEYELTETLRAAVDRINAAVAAEAIAFVMVLGDLSDSGERSELVRCREILEELTVPWFPLLGNHDAWPYTSDDEAPEPTGDALLWEIYGADIEAAGALMEGFVPSPGPTHNPEHDVTSHFVDYAFDLRGHHFVVLDLVTRTHAWLGNPGVNPEADLHDFEGGTWPWLEDLLASYAGAPDDSIFLFCHHPPFVTSLGIDGLSVGEADRLHDLIRDSGLGDAIYGIFSGHHHLNYELVLYEGQHIVATAAAKDGGGVRLVRIDAEGAIDYDTML